MAYPVQPKFNIIPPNNDCSTGPKALIEAAGNGNSAFCETLLKENPDHVNGKGWNGFTALHKACLRGDLTTVAILLAANADTNVRNDAGETPLHFAAKRGMVRVAHVLIQHGASADSADDQGRNALHHAAQGGWVTMLHYLSELHGVGCFSVDRHLKTPLHVACQHGHTDAVLYLLRHGRSEVGRADAAGNTALHYAAQQRHIDISWRLASAPCGRDALHALNKEGKTPAEMALASKPSPGEVALYGDFERNLQAAKWLQYWMKGRPRHSLYPRWLWWWNLLLPATFCCGIILLCSLLVPNYQICVAGPGVGWLAHILMNHEHRLQHPCRWPNPSFLGLFVTGISFSIACYLVKIVPVVFGISPLLDGLCIMGIIIMIPTFSVLLWRDPGTVREARRRPLAAAATGMDAGDGCRGDEEDATSPYMTIRDVATGAVPQEGFCGFCEIVMPDRTKHCRLCESCMHTMDHHCLFLTKCVARGNHRLFLSFVFVLAVAMAMFLANVVVYVNATYGELGAAAAIARATLRDALVLAAATLNAATLVWCIALLKYQVALVCVDRTTVQNLMFASPARARGAPCRRFSTREKLVNLVAFCLGRDIGAADGGAPKLLV